MTGTIHAVEPNWHEFTENLIFARDGLKPYFAADNAVKTAGGSRKDEFSVQGERWIATLYYQDSGIVNPGEHTPQGTPFKLDEVREYRIAIDRHPDEDSIEEQGLNAHLSPRWQGMETENKKGEISEFSVPDEIDEGVNVQLKGSNIDPFRYPRLLREAANAVGISAHHFENPNDVSNVQDAERYVRIDRDASGPIHAREGPIANLGHLLEHDREGYRKIVQNDDDERGRNLPGYYHTVTLDQRRIREAFPSHDLPVEIKHYYAREAYKKPKDDPLAHPKLGVSYQVSRWDGKLDADDEALDQLRHELDRILHAVLIDAGMNIAPAEGTGPYVPDAYFSPSVGEFPEPPTLDLAHVKHEQENVVIRYVSDGLSPVQTEALSHLVTDGGKVSPADIAENTGRHVGSVRRALRDMDDLVDRKYGEVAIRSTYVAELVTDAVRDAQEAVSRAVDSAGRALMAAERGLDERTSALLAWCSKHDVSAHDRDGAKKKIRCGRTNSPTEEIQRGYRLWTDAGRDPAAFRQATVTFEKPRRDGGTDTMNVPAWRIIQ